MPTNEYGQPTDSKGNVLTQSQVIEQELLEVIKGFEPVGHLDGTPEQNIIPNGYDLLKDERTEYGFYWEYEDMQLCAKKLAALVLKHRHDVYFQAFKDGVVAGRKEGKAEGIAALEGLTFYVRWNKSDELPAEIEKRIALLKGDDDTFASRS